MEAQDRARSRVVSPGQHQGTTKHLHRGFSKHLELFLKTGIKPGGNRLQINYRRAHRACVIFFIFIF